MARVTPLRLLQCSLVAAALVVLCGRYVRVSPRAGADAGKLSAAQISALRRGASAAEIADAAEKRLVAEHQKAQAQQKRQQLVRATEPPRHWEEAAVPDRWLHGDWSGLEPGAAASASAPAIVDASIKKYAFNAHKSAELPLRRPLQDMRSQQCQAQLYPAVAELPVASVVICFVDEMWSTLFRTVWSVLDRTPRSLLLEVILVDDASDAAWLKEDLKDYMARLPPIVRLVRSEERLGLIKARTLGAEQATGDIIVFLDSHTEASAGWYEPIASRISESRNTIVCPTIDSISDRNLAYNSGGGTAVGGFHWTLDFTWIYRPLEPGRTHADPMTSPTMAGGLFAVNREYWNELGGYDLEMGGWGGENLELSFRVWTCGGSMEIHPCSHIGHIFRSSHPYVVPGGFGEVYLRNSARLAAAWMDEYADVYFRIRPSAQRQDYGDVSARVALRRRLDCKPFKWYLDKFFASDFVPLVENSKAEGQLRNQAARCVDKMGHQHPGESLGLYGCHGKETPSLNQAFILTHDGQIRTMWGLCFDQGFKSRGGDASRVRLSACKVPGPWTYDDAALTLKHGDQGLCLDARGDQLILADCVDGRLEQLWKFSGSLNA